MSTESKCRCCGREPVKTWADLEGLVGEAEMTVSITNQMVDTIGHSFFKQIGAEGRRQRSDHRVLVSVGEIDRLVWMAGEADYRFRVMKEAFDQLLSASVKVAA